MINRHFKNILQIIVFAALGILILYLLWQSLGNQYLEQCALSAIPVENCSLIDKLISDYKGAKVFWLVVISICFLFSQIFRSIRWVILLRPLGYEISQFNSFATMMVGYFANLGAPRIGEFVRAGLISKYEKIPIEKAFASIVIGRIVDLLMLLTMIALGLIFRYEQLWGYISKHVDLSTTTLVVVLSILLVGGLVGLFLLRKILHLKDENLSPLSKKIKNLVSGFVTGIRDIRKLPNVTAFWLYSIGIWLMYYLMHYLAFFSFEPVSHLSPMDGLLVFDFGSLGILFPSQGGLGSYHVMIVEALKIFDVNPIDGMSFAMITFFTLTIFCTIIMGMISLILLPVVNKKKASESKN